MEKTADASDRDEEGRYRASESAHTRTHTCSLRQQGAREKERKGAIKGAEEGRRARQESTANTERQKKRERQKNGERKIEM